MSDEPLSPSSGFRRRKPYSSLLVENKLELAQHEPEQPKTNRRFFRWTACFSFISKFKRSKQKPDKPTPPLDPSRRRHSSIVPIQTDETTFEDASPRVRPFTYCMNRKEVDAPYTEEKVDRLESSSVTPWNDHSSLPNTPISALSPPPRYVTAKKDRLRYGSDWMQEDNASSSRLQSRVPISRPFALRLSLDIDQHCSSLSHSPSTLSVASNDTKREDEDSMSIRTAFTIHRPDPIKECSENPMPEMIPRQQQQQEEQSHPSSATAAGKSIPLLTPGSSSLTDLPISSSSSFSLGEQSDRHRLSLIERRRRRSPQIIPDDDRLTLALENSSKWSSDDECREPVDRLASSHMVEMPEDVPQHDLAWRQRVLDQSVDGAFKNKSRQKAMMALEGKTKTVTMTPIAAISEIDNALASYEVDVVRDKAQYEAVVARTLHRRPCSQEECQTMVACTSVKPLYDGVNALRVISEDEDDNAQQVRLAAEPERLDRRFLCPTPPSSAHHPMSKTRTPSLVFFPSSPSSMGSSGENEALQMNN
ncbi:hypothetical protein EC973_000139 [Apophysomyces ossiformis]|uniref:Uncharacterized protein n=1 Tax=Apophysomyces ossiformis TaxID=679940 RepID=A0A8H7ETX1_9FUNG|nr:hypothetical protein EC973_000139 [Apophysomyces ossiformis]